MRSGAKYGQVRSGAKLVDILSPYFCDVKYRYTSWFLEMHETDLISLLSDVYGGESDISSPLHVRVLRTLQRKREEKESAQILIMNICVIKVGRLSFSFAFSPPQVKS